MSELKPTIRDQITQQIKNKLELEKADHISYNILINFIDKSKSLN